jgi:hypothetical protein
LSSSASAIDASRAQRDAVALLGMLMLAGGVAPAMAVESSRRNPDNSNPSIQGGGPTLGVLLLLVAADGVRFPVRVPSQPLHVTPMHKPMQDRAASTGGMLGIKPQLPCWGGEARRERVGQLVEWRASRHRFFVVCADETVAPMPRGEEFRRHGAGNWFMRNP